MSQAQSDPLQAMMLLLNGHLHEQALHVAAVLGIADHIHRGARSAAELARLVDTDPEALRRILRLLVAMDVFVEDVDGHLSLTPLGEMLREDAPRSVRDRAVFYGAPPMWAALSNLMHSVRTGQSAFAQTHGQGFYDYAFRHPGIGDPFSRYMTRTSQQHVAPMIEAYDFSRFRTLIDLGGGQGGTLVAILRACPALQGILFDLPAVVATAEELDAPEIAARSARIGGDLRDPVLPPGIDAYLLKWVLMDHSDEEAIALLQHCAEAMAPDGRVLVVEMLLPERNPPLFAAALDVQMLLLFGRARLRTEREWHGLFAQAGLALSLCVATASPNSVLEAVRSV